MAKLRFEVVCFGPEDGPWFVACFDGNRENTGQGARFAGPNAEARAREYAAFKNGATFHRDGLNNGA